MLDAFERSTLLELARTSVRLGLDSLPPPSPPRSMSAALADERACFVTLTLKRNLRGCIGSLEPRRPLWLDAAENARLAAFSDPRFPPLARIEEPLVSFEISVLTLPSPWEGAPDEILDFLARDKVGLVFALGGSRSTFLPQVWEELPDPAAFLAALARKAGQPSHSWKNTGAKFWTYRVENFADGISP